MEDAASRRWAASFQRLVMAAHVLWDDGLVTEPKNSTFRFAASTLQANRPTRKPLAEASAIPVTD